MTLSGLIVMKIWNILALSAALCGASISVQAASMEGDWEFGGRVGMLNIDSDTALQQGIDDSAYVVGGFTNYVQNGWVTSAALDIVVYDDNEEFRQLVESDGIFNDGDLSIESSDASAGLFSVATGYQWYLGEDNNTITRAQIGFTAVFASERSIVNCDDCFSEDIDVDGGAFIKGSIERNLGSVAVGLYLQQYLGGDGLSNSIGINISTGF